MWIILSYGNYLSIVQLNVCLKLLGTTLELNISYI